MKSSEKKPKYALEENNQAFSTNPWIDKSSEKGSGTNAQLDKIKAYKWLRGAKFSLKSKLYEC